MTGYGATWRDNVDGIGERLAEAARSDRLPAVVARRTVIAIAFYLVVRHVFALTPKLTIDGLALGSLYGVVGVALVLTYRTSRIINFAAAAVGAVPAITAVLLSTANHVNYLLTMPIALVGGTLTGILTELVVLRRFKRASRLIVTVVSIGIAQSYAALGFFIPVWFGERASAVPKVTTPWQNLTYHSSRGEPILTGNQVFAFLVVVVLTFALMYFLKRTRLGIALRAASENGERAQLLGIPVNLVNMAAWGFAGLLSASAIFAQAPIIGVPSDATLGFDTLLYGLAAAVVARFENIGLALLTGLGVGLLIAGSVSKYGDYSNSNGLMLAVILIGMLVQRRSRSRAVDQNASSWQTVATFRPIPVELRAMPEVVRARTIGVAAVLGLAVALPYVVSSTYIYQLQLLPIYGIVGVSLVVLTGWAGQISLGQFGLVGIAAGVVGGVVARHNPDFFIALALGIVAGAGAAVVIGLPAVRMQGLFLAVTTLAFGYATQFYFLNINYWFGKRLLPTSFASTIRRPVLYGKFELENSVGGERAFYFLCLGLLLLCMLAAASFRRQHSGRVLIALRDNQRAATSYTVSPVKTRLAAFAIAGGICGIAGTLYVYDQHRVTAGNYSTVASIGVFLACAVGGLGSLAAGVLGAILYEAFVLFGPHLYGALGPTWVAVMPLLLTGPLLVLNLYVNPGGLAGWAFDVRDDWLRRVAARRRIHVPSLVADRLVEDTSMPEPDASPYPAAPALAGVPLLSCRGVDVAYDKVQVLFGVDVDIHHGEIVALLGTNGAGKSTLLKAVSGLVHPIAGQIQFEGSDITQASPMRTTELGIVQVPGGKAVFPTLTVAEHFKAGQWLYARQGADEVADRTEQVLAMFPRVKERWHNLAGDLSGGEQQQLAIGMAFVARPRLLVIDELSLGLAPIIVERLLEAVRAIHADGATVVLVEQSVNVALTLASRAYFMEKGQVRFEGATADLLDRGDVLRSVFLDRANASLDGEPRARTRSRAKATEEVDRAPVLEVRGLTKSFGGINAVTDVSFTVHEDEILGLIGPNGAGKTTIFDMISGHLPSNGGRIILAGQDITGWAPERRATIGLGRSFQDARIFPSLTVAENIALGLERHIEVRDHISALFGTPAMRESETDVAFTVDDLVDLMGLGAFRDKFVAELSTGSRRIVDLAMSIAHDPTVLLLDEPSSGIAQRETEALGPLLRRIRDEAGCALLVIEHDMPLITSLSDSIVALDLGHVLVQGPPQQVMTDERVVSAYLGNDPATINRSAAAASSSKQTRRRVKAGAR